MNQPIAAPESPGFSDYFSVIRKRRRLLLTIAFPVLALACMLAIGLPDMYRSSGLIEIEDAQTAYRNTTRTDGVQESPYADQYVQSLSTIVLASSNLKRLLAEHQLYEGQQEDQEAALKQLRNDIKVDIVTVPILDPESGRERQVVTAFTVAYDNLDAERAKQGADWLVDAYLEQNRRDRQQNAANKAQFFSGEAERMRKRVGELEERLAAFKRENVGRLPELNQVNMNVMDRTETEIQNIESQMQALRRERVFLVAQLQQARATGPETGNLRQMEEEYKRRAAIYDESHPDLISMRRQIDMLRRGGSSTGMSLRAQLENQRSILSETRQRYSADHPDVKRIQRNIESLEARIAAGETADRSVASDSPMSMQVQAQLNATDTQLAALQARGSELRAKMTDLEARIDSAPQVEQQYQEVTRDLASARAKYDELLRRQMDAEVSESEIAGGSADKFKVTSAPMLPAAPANPKRLAIALIGVVLAAILGFSAVVIAQLLDQSVRGTQDVREILGVLPLTAVPVIENSGAAALRRRSTMMFAMRTAIGMAVVYYVVAQFIL
jgi:succinoglycan biosynthesis transport protein ExoP